MFHSAGFGQILKNCLAMAVIRLQVRYAEQAIQTDWPQLCYSEEFMEKTKWRLCLAIIYFMEATYSKLVRNIMIGGGVIFAYQCSDPQHYGVLSLMKNKMLFD